MQFCVLLKDTSAQQMLVFAHFITQRRDTKQYDTLQYDVF